MCTDKWKGRMIWLSWSVFVDGLSLLRAGREESIVVFSIADICENNSSSSFVTLVSIPRFRYLVIDERFTVTKAG